MIKYPFPVYLPKVEKFLYIRTNTIVIMDTVHKNFPKNIHQDLLLTLAKPFELRALEWYLMVGASKVVLKIETISIPPHRYSQHQIFVWRPVAQG